MTTKSSRSNKVRKRLATERGDRKRRDASRSESPTAGSLNAPRQLIVLGMHRSGTSATAGALAAMGVFVGDETELTPKSWENPAGFFERRDARKICDALLHQSGADWWKVSAFNADNANREAVRSQRSAIHDLVQRLNGHGTWLVKEPRLCFLLPIFQAALNNPVAIVPLRHPIEVARSLRRRNGFSIQAGLALWEAYVVSLLRVSSEMDRIFVDYEALTLDPASALATLAADLSQRGVVDLDVNAAIASIQPSLRRERHNETVDSELLTPPQRRLWKGLARGCAFKTAPALSASALTLLQEFESDEASRQNARASIKTLSGKLESLQSVQAEGKASADKGASEASEATRRLNELAAQAEELKRTLQLQTTANEVSRAEIEQLRATVAVQSQQRTDSQLEVGVLRARLDMATQQTEDLRRELSVRESQANERQVARDLLQLRYTQQCERAADDARRIEQAQRDLSARGAELVERQAELRLLQLRYSEQAERSADDARRLQELIAALAARDASNADIGAALEASRTDQATLRSELSALSAENRALRDRSAEQEKRLGAEARAVETISAELVAKGEEHVELQQKLQESTAEVSERETALVELRTVVERLEEERARIRSELTAVRSELRSSLSVQDDVASELRGALATAKAENATLREGLSLESSTARELRERHARTVDQLKRVTDELKAAGKKQSALAAKTTRQRDRLRLQRERARRQQARARALTAELAALSVKSEALATRLAAIESSTGWRLASSISRAARRLAFTGKKNSAAHIGEAARSHEGRAGGSSTRPSAESAVEQEPENKAGPAATAVPEAVATTHNVLAGVLAERTSQSVFGRTLRNMATEKVPRRLRELLEWSERDLEAAAATIAERQDLPLVTIVMPTFNRERIIGEAIQTVIEQVYENWELIVCDDASTDGTESVVASFKDPRIHYQKLTKSGAAAARNAGLKQSRGAFIAYLDSDNYWHPCYLAKMVLSLLESSGHSAVFGNYIDFKVNSEGQASIKAFERPAFNHEKLLEKNFIDLNSFVHRRELYDSFGGFNEALTRRQDYDLIIKYTWLRDPLQVDNALTLYQRNGALNQITTTHRNDDSCVTLINGSIEQYLRSGIPSAAAAKPIKRVTILSWDLCRNHFSKPFALAEALSESYDVQLVAFRFFDEPIFPPLKEVKPRFRTDYFDGADFPDFFATMRKALDVIDGDIIYVVKPRLPSLGLALLANAERGVPIVLEINDLETVVGSPKAADRHAEESFEQLDPGDRRLVSPYSDMWSRIMDPIAKDLPVLLTHNKNIDAHFGNRCLYMRNIKDERAYDVHAYDRDATRAALGFAPDDRVILFGGMLRKHKGIYELVELMERLADPRYKLLFVGSRETPDQKKLVERYRDKVRVLPPQDREAMARINHASDLVILWLDPAVPASHYQMPYKATDAFAMGPTIIANDISDLAPLAQQGYLHTVPYGDWDAMIGVIHNVFEDPRRTVAMRDACRRLFLRQFSYHAARNNFELAAFRASREIGGPLNVAETFASRFNQFYRHSTASAADFSAGSKKQAPAPVPAAVAHIDGGERNDDERSIAIVDLERVTDTEVDDASGIAVVMPTRDVQKAYETARVLVRRAGMSVRVLIAEESDEQGFVGIVNNAAERIRARYIAFLSERVFPGKDWLRLAHESLESSGKGMFAFNCGRWGGRIAEAGMVRVGWARGVYGGPIFHPHYQSREAARELTLIARANGEFMHDAEAVVASLDFDSVAVPADQRLFNQRFLDGFDGRFAPTEIETYSEEFLNGSSDTAAATERAHDERIHVIDIKDVESIRRRDAEGVAVVMPSIDTARGLSAARRLAFRAGMPAQFYVVDDSLRQGFIKTLNQTASQLDVKYVVYLAEDAVPGIDWLRIAHEALEDSGKGLLAFNCGKWRGRIAAFGMVRKSWIQKLYGGDILHSAYRSHRADNEVTAIARATGEFVYCAEALLVENDANKVFRVAESSAGNFTPDDRRLFVRRFNDCFGGLVTKEALDPMRDEYLNQRKLAAQRAAG